MLSSNAKELTLVKDCYIPILMITTPSSGLSYLQDLLSMSTIDNIEYVLYCVPNLADGHTD